MSEQLRAENERLKEAAGAVLDAIGWHGYNPTLKIGYQGQGGDVEQFEEGLHDLATLCLPNPEAGR